MAEKKFSFLVEGGRANAGPPIGPALGPLGINVIDVVNEINRLTKEFSGMRVPVTVKVDLTTKKFSVEVGIPSTSALLLREVGAEKGAETPSKPIGDLSMRQVVKIAKLKMPSMLAKTLKAAVKEVLGTCRSLGITVEGRDPKEVQRLVDRGVYDDLIREVEEK